MPAFIGVVDNPYSPSPAPTARTRFATSRPGDYVLGVWQETLGTQEQKITILPHGKTTASFTYKGA